MGRYNTTTRALARQASTYYQAKKEERERFDTVGRYRGTRVRNAIPETWRQWTSRKVQETLGFRAPRQADSQLNFPVCRNLEYTPPIAFICADGQPNQHWQAFCQIGNPDSYHVSQADCDGYPLLTPNADSDPSCNMTAQREACAPKIATGPTTANATYEPPPSQGLPTNPSGKSANHTNIVAGAVVGGGGAIGGTVGLFLVGRHYYKKAVHALKWQPETPASRVRHASESNSIEFENDPRPPAV